MFKGIGKLSGSTYKGTNSSAEFKWSNGAESSINSAFLNAQRFVDSEVIRLMEPYTPRLTGMMIRSAITNTQIGTGVVSQQTPYSTWQYYNNPGGEGLRGSQWFERMKAAHREDIIRGAATFFRVMG